MNLFFSTQFTCLYIHSSDSIELPASARAEGERKRVEGLEKGKRSSGGDSFHCGCPFAGMTILTRFSPALLAQREVLFYRYNTLWLPN